MCIRDRQIALAGGAGGDNAGVRVVAIDTVERGVLAGEEIAILMAGVLDEAVGDDELAGHVAVHTPVSYTHLDVYKRQPLS